MSPAVRNYASMFTLRFPLTFPPERTLSMDTRSLAFGTYQAHLEGSAPYYTLIVEGIPDEVAAKELLTELREAVAYLALCCDLPIRSTYEPATPRYYDTPRPTPGAPGSQTADGLVQRGFPVIHPSGKSIQFIGMSGSMTVSQGANETLQDLARWFELPHRARNLANTRLVTAMDLYAAHLTQPKADVRFLNLIMALEALCDPVHKTQAVQDMMGRWEQELDGALGAQFAEDVASQENKECLLALKGELSFRRSNSIGQQMKALVRRALAGDSDRETCVKRVGQLYDQRSKLLHRGTFASDDPMRLEDARRIVKRVLISLAGFMPRAVD